MRTRCKKLLALLLALAMIVSMVPMSALAAEETATYTKVTVAPDDWSGEYLLVYEVDTENAYAFDGSLAAPDVANNYQNVSVSEGSITADSSIAVKIEAVDGGYVLCSASGLYLYHSSNANKLSFTADKETAAKYPLTITVTGDGIDIVLSGGAHMRFNANDDQMRFRYYKSSSYSNQKAVTLYKLEDDTTNPEPEEPEVTAPFVDGDQVVIMHPPITRHCPAKRPATTMLALT